MQAARGPDGPKPIIQGAGIQGAKSESSQDKVLSVFSENISHVPGTSKNQEKHNVKDITDELDILDQFEKENQPVKSKVGKNTENELKRELRNEYKLKKAASKYDEALKKAETGKSSARKKMDSVELDEDSTKLALPKKLKEIDDDVEHTLKPLSETDISSIDTTIAGKDIEIAQKKHVKEKTVTLIIEQFYDNNIIDFETNIRKLNPAQLDDFLAQVPPEIMDDVVDNDLVKDDIKSLFVEKQIEIRNKRISELETPEEQPTADSDLALNDEEERLLADDDAVNYDELLGELEASEEQPTAGDDVDDYYERLSELEASDKQPTADDVDDYYERLSELEAPTESRPSIVKSADIARSNLTEPSTTPEKITPLTRKNIKNKSGFFNVARRIVKMVSRFFKSLFSPSVSKPGSFTGRYIQDLRSRKSKSLPNDQV